ncbi:MAG: hypothetical protein IJT91_06040 [Clostridia bacterium]|nr:hypothetical protein [Clostridia bacterium]
MRRSKKPLRNAKLTGKALILTIAAAVAIFVAVAATVSVIFDIEGPITNWFRKSYVESEVVETLDNGVKKNVSIKNTGDIPAYIRAAVVVNWKDASGNVSGTVPVAGVDYTINFDLAHGWKKSSDGYYYYIYPVAPSQYTGVLVTSCTPVSGTAPAGYGLSVEILGSAIQSKPANLVVEKWSGVVSVSGTTLTVN